MPEKTTPEPEAEAPETETPAEAAAEAVTTEETPKPEEEAKPESKSAKDFEALMRNGTSEEIDAAMQRIEKGEDPFADATSDAEVETETKVESKSEDEDEKTDTAAEAAVETRLPRRVQIKNLPTADRIKIVAAFDLVHENPEKSIWDALREVGGISKAAEAVVEKETPKDTPAKPDRATEIADLLAQRKTARAAYDNDLVDELDGKLAVAHAAQIKDEIRAEVAAEHAAQVLEDAVDKSAASVIAIAPDFTKKGTPLNDAANAVLAEARAHNPAFFKNPKWPIMAYAMACAEAQIPMLPLNGKPLEKPATPVKAVVVPKKNGSAAPMLTAGRAPAQAAGTLFARAISKETSQADTIAALEALGI